MAVSVTPSVYPRSLKGHQLLEQRITETTVRLMLIRNRTSKSFTGRHLQENRAQGPKARQVQRFRDSIDTIDPTVIILEQCEPRCHECMIFYAIFQNLPVSSLHGDVKPPVKKRVDRVVSIQISPTTRRCTLSSHIHVIRIQ